jgi:hypothetical protein
MLAQYASLLEACLAETATPIDRSYLFAQLSAARDASAALLREELGAAASIINEEGRVVGWEQMPGSKGGAAQDLLVRLSNALLNARLENAPNADWRQCVNESWH